MCRYGKEYKDTSSLRYGHLLIMTDQDYDGSHIKGLVLNLFETFWPSLLKLDFVSQFITPIVKVTRKKEEHTFFTVKEFQDWSSKEKDLKSWKIKYFVSVSSLMYRYYKGLGTSTAKEGKEYFSNLPRHVLPFAPLTASESNLIDMCFKRSRCEERKEWIDGFDPESYIDYGSIWKSVLMFREESCADLRFHQQGIDSVFAPGLHSIDSEYD